MPGPSEIPSPKNSISRVVVVAWRIRKTANSVHRCSILPIKSLLPYKDARSIDLWPDDGISRHRYRADLSGINLVLAPIDSIRTSATRLRPIAGEFPRGREKKNERDEGRRRKERDFRGLVAVPSQRRLEEEGNRLKGRVTQSISEKASGGSLCCSRAPGTFVFSPNPRPTPLSVAFLSQVASIDVPVAVVWNPPRCRGNVRDSH